MSSIDEQYLKDEQQQALLDGHIVPAGGGVGVNDAIPKDSGSNPIQDAIDLVYNNSGSSEGTVFLPPNYMLLTARYRCARASTSSGPETSSPAVAR